MTRVPSLPQDWSSPRASSAARGGRRLVLTLLAALAPALSACGPTTNAVADASVAADDLAPLTRSQACRAAATATCQRVYACTSPMQRMSASFQMTFGTSEQDCAATLPDRQCGSVSDACPAPGAWNAVAGAQCTVDIQTASCAAINAGTFCSVACKSTCGASDAGC